MITDYYTFLTSFYLPSSALKFPPPEGWPNITPDITRSLDKSSIVIELMKHLPYIDETESCQMITNIHYKSDVVDYSVLTAEDFSSGLVTEPEEGLRDGIREIENSRKEADDKSENEEDEEDDSNDEDIPDDDGNASEQDDSETTSVVSNWWGDDDPDEIDPKNLLVLSRGYESGGRTLILDVYKGNVHEDMIRCNLLSGVTIERFFADLRDKLQRLVYVPVRGEFYEDVPEVSDHGPVHETADPSLDMCDEEHAKVYKRIYRKYGWPGKEYNKIEALKAVERYRQSIP
jgi:hypothetical protein